MNKISTERSGRGAERVGGSSLVIVLGMLAVLTLMSIAFTTFMRTEHAGTTNLKNGMVARQALSTAIARVTDAIDLSFDDPSVAQPVPLWQEPYLTSSSTETNDFMQSERLDAGEKPSAQLLTYELSRYLTPAQIALVRSAKIDWAPIYGSVKASVPKSKRPTGINMYGNFGRPGGDSIIGRYAFIALPTTGLLDINLAGTNANSQAAAGNNGSPRADNNGSDPHSFVLPNSNASFAWNGSGDTVEVPFQIQPGQANNFLKGRRDGGGFVSFADARNKLETKNKSSLWLGGATSSGGTVLDLLYPGSKTSFGKATRWNSGSPTKNSFFPADAFAGFSTALEGSDPDGRPKVHLPTPAEFSNYSATELRAFANRCLTAMVKVFARSRISAGLARGDVEDSKKDAFTFFEKESSAKFSISRARLATVAMLDALDDDNVPGTFQSGAASGTSWWTSLNNISDGVLVSNSDPDENPFEVSDSKPLSGSEPSGSTAYLNYPVTEPVPLLSHAYAYVTWERVETNTVVNGAAGTKNWAFSGSDGWQNSIQRSAGAGGGTVQGLRPDGTDFRNWRVVYYGKIHCGAVANVQNDVPGWQNALAGKSYSMQMDWDVMTDFPRRNTVAGDGSADTLDAFLNGDNGEQEWGVGNAVQIGPGGVAVVNPSSQFSTGAGQYHSKTASASGLSVGSGNPVNRFIEVDSDMNGGSLEFYVVCQPSSVPSANDVVRDANNNPVSWSSSALQHLEFYPPTAAEMGSDEDDVFIPVRMKVTIKEGSRTIQQVPAPALDSAGRGKWWLRLDAGAWHRNGNGSNSKFQGDSTSSVLDYIRAWNADRAEAVEKLAWGWAICAVPQFGFDTTSLMTNDESEGGIQSDYPCGRPDEPGSPQVWINNRICLSDGSRIYDEETGKSGDDQYVPMALLRSIDRDSGVFEYLMGPQAAKNNYSDSGLSVATLGNMLQKRFLIGNIVGGSGTPTLSLAKSWLTGNKTYTYACRPDFAHRWKSPGGDIKDSSDGSFWAYSNSDVTELVKTRIYNGRRSSDLDDESRENAVFRTPADLGSVMCGPMETLSIFRTYRPANSRGQNPTYRSDFHPVFDYFSGWNDARWPQEIDYAGKINASTGDINADSLEKSGGFGSSVKMAYPAVTNGTVNLNAPALVHLEGRNNSQAPRAVSWTHGSGRTFDAMSRYVPNLYPIFTALLGAEYQARTQSSSQKPRCLDESQAAAIADAFETASVEAAQRYGSHRFALPTEMDSGPYSNNGWPMVRSLSDLLSEPDGEESLANPVLEEIMNGNSSLQGIVSDGDREALIANVAGAFSGRGQSFLVLVRADAYTPKFGEEESTSDGNSLATTHALVELWRDPEPARRADGTFPAVGQNTYLFHNWYIRSVRVF